MFTIDDVPAIIPALMEILQGLPDGECISTAGLCSRAGFNAEDIAEVLPEIHRCLIEAADAANIRPEYVRRGRERTGPIWEAEFRISRREPEEATFESEFRKAFGADPEEERPLKPLADPADLFNRYMEVIFANDGLWEQFQIYVRQSLPGRGEDFFAYRRDPGSIVIWRQVIGNMGMGHAPTLFAAAAFLLLALHYQGRDLNIELIRACRKLEQQEAEEEE